MAFNELTTISLFLSSEQSDSRFISNIEAQFSYLNKLKYLNNEKKAKN